MKVRIGSYMYSNNYGTHAMAVEIGQLILWFSYSTVVAFRTPNTGTVVCENIWGATTGKHLNSIDGGKKGLRLSKEKFDRKLFETLENYQLEVANV